MLTHRKFPAPLRGLSPSSLAQCLRLPRRKPWETKRAEQLRPPLRDHAAVDRIEPVRASKSVIDSLSSEGGLVTFAKRLARAAVAELAIDPRKVLGYLAST